MLHKMVWMTVIIFHKKKKKVESLEKLTGKIIFPECVSEKILRQLQVFHEI